MPPRSRYCRSWPSRAARQQPPTQRADLAEEELAQAAVIESYLPKQLSATEIEEIVKGIIAETGASSMKDMGRVMGIATKQLAGEADGGAVSQIVKRLLA